jgi:hypothetical protein
MPHECSIDGLTDWKGCSPAAGDLSVPRIWVLYGLNRDEQSGVVEMQMSTLLQSTEPPFFFGNWFEKFPGLGYQRVLIQYPFKEWPATLTRVSKQQSIWNLAAIITHRGCSGGLSKCSLVLPFLVCSGDPSNGFLLDNIAGYHSEQFTRKAHQGGFGSYICTWHDDCDYPVIVIVDQCEEQFSGW